MAGNPSNNVNVYLAERVSEIRKKRREDRVRFVLGSLVFAGIFAGLAGAVWVTLE